MHTSRLKNHPTNPNPNTQKNGPKPILIAFKSFSSPFAISHFSVLMTPKCTFAAQKHTFAAQKHLIIQHFSHHRNHRNHPSPQKNV
jgi:hypothetical protein